MSTVEEIIAAVKELSPAERNDVWRQVDSLLRSPDLSKSDHVNHGHHDSPQSLPIRRVRPRRPPIRIKGKPISETVVEDRR